MTPKIKVGLHVAGFAAALALGAVIGHATAAQPQMAAALDALQGARSHLVAANNDKGGHRGKAIRAVDDAIAETRAGIRYAGY
ncbi:MAG: hypothetical protein WA047_12980 [Phenylobacterium sp.]|jgi:methionine aminopeptidase|uniref:hypothetical protein n=1 Tax=Phenylobacterium sp. TaxID=1871053 RepID=UPI003BB4CF6E